MMVHVMLYLISESSEEWQVDQYGTCLEHDALYRMLFIQCFECMMAAWIGGGLHCLCMHWECAVRSKKPLQAFWDGRF